MIKKDKILHFVAGAAISSIVHVLSGGSIFYAILLAFVIGLLKEIYDSFFPKKHTKDFWDFAVTGLGGLVAVILIEILLKI